MKRIGLNFESIFHTRVPLPLVRSFAAMCGEGMPAIYRFVWDRFEPEPLRLNIAALTADIRALIDGGAKEITIVRSGVPYWATVDGTRTWHTYDDGCMSLGRTGTDADRDVPFAGYAEHRPHCSKPTHVVPLELSSIGERLAKFIWDTFGRLGNSPRFVFCGGPNEPTQAAYNPWEAMLARGRMSADEEVRFTVDEQTFPFVRGVRSVDPEARILWGEFDAHHTVERFLPAYMASGLVRPTDVLGLHPLAWDEGGTFEDAYRRGAEMTAMIQQQAPGAEVWFTECADRRKRSNHFQGRVDFTSACLDLPNVTRVFWWDHDQFFQPDGTTAQDRDEGVAAMKALALALAPAAPDDPELALLRLLAKDRREFSDIVSAALPEFSGDVYELLRRCTSVGESNGTIQSEADAVLSVARNIKAALAAKRRAVRS